MAILKKVEPAGRCTRVLAALLLVGAAQAALAADISVLSAGAIEPGIRPALAAFEALTGHLVTLTFATAPQIRQRVEAGAAIDVVIAPPAVLDALAALDATAIAMASKFPADNTQRVAIGRVGVGVAVRPGAPLPDLSSTESLKRELLAADSLVFNRASTGAHFDTVLKKLGIEAPAAAKTTRYPDGASVMEHVLRGQGRELGVGAITEILLLRDKGLQLADPLPPEVQNLTAYAAVAARLPASDATAALLAHLRSPATQAGLKAAGVAAER